MSTPRRPSLKLLALPLAVALAIGTAAQATETPAPPSPPAKSRGLRVEYERIVEQAQEQAREAITRAEEYARDAARQGDLLAQLDYDLELPTLAFIGSEFGATREIVKNAPYTAEAVSESIQVLQDGNRIVKRTTTKLARDTYGRTRQEKEGPHGSAVYIFDPIDNRNYALNPQKRSAVRIPRVPAIPVPPMPPMSESAPTPAPSAPTAPMVAIAPRAPVAPVPPTPPLPPAPHQVTSTETARVVVRRGDSTSRPDDVRVEVIRMGGREGNGVASLGPLPPIAMPLLPQGKGERTSLGTRDFDGVKADGTQTTHTIPAGEIGNEKAIVITSERWFSPELQLVVFARTRDPRAGETTYRLTNLRRGEPAADLFRVPSDYRTRDPRG